MHSLSPSLMLLPLMTIGFLVSCVCPYFGTFGIITALLCTIALFIGKKLGSLLGDRAEMVGGVVLIVIGLKAFFG